MRHFWILALLAAVAAPAGAAGDEGRKMSLMDAYSLAKERDAAHAADRAARDAGVEKAEQGWAALAPVIGLEGSAGYTEQNVTYKGTSLLKGGHSAYPAGSATLALSQPLFRPQNWALHKQGVAAAQMAGAAFELSSQDLILRVAGAYFKVLLARNQMEAIVAYKEAISERLARAKKSFEVGTASITDTHEAQARYDMALSREVVVAQGLQLAGEELAKITGEPAFQLSRFKDDFVPAPPSPDQIDHWAAEAEKNSRYLEMKRKALEIAAREAEKARGAALPSLDLSASYTYVNQGGSNLGIGMESSNQQAGLKLSFPLYTGGAVSSRIREAAANEEKARQELEEARRQTRLAARGAYLGVKSAQAEVNALKQALVSSQSALASTQQGFEVGLRSAVDVLDMQQMYFDARQALAAAKYNYLLSLLRLEAAAGTLSGEGLARVSEYLLGGQP